MARHLTTPARAFEMLRAHSRHNGRKLSAAAVVESHLLLLPPPRSGSAQTTATVLRFRQELRPPA
jgi:hypothetical protein